MKALDVISRVAMPQQIAEIARPIALRHHVNELYLFGSMARGEGHTDSDIDFIYQFDDTANPMIDEWALRDDLASTFGREIDLVKKQYITTELQDKLAEMQRVIFVNSITSNPMFRIIWGVSYLSFPSILGFLMTMRFGELTNIGQVAVSNATV